MFRSDGAHQDYFIRNSVAHLSGSLPGSITRRGVVHPQSHSGGQTAPDLESRIECMMSSSRLEVGVLNFEVVERTDFNEQSLNLHGKFSDGIRASKLSITESGVTLECGIVLTGVDQIFIAPGAFPMTLALKGIEFDSPARDPEYPWDEYERSEF